MHICLRHHHDGKSRQQFVSTISSSDLCRGHYIWPLKFNEEVLYMATIRKLSVQRAPGVVLRLQKGKRANHLFLDIHSNGIRTREFLRLYLVGDENADRETLLKAEQIRTTRLQQLHARRYGIQPIDYQWQKDFTRYFADLARSRGGNWKTTLSHIRTAFPSQQSFADINESWIRHFISYLRKRELHINSITIYAEILKTALNVAVREHVIPRNPFEDIDAPRRKRTQRTFLTIEELQQLANAECSKPEIKRMFLFACFTGLRISDIRRLTWGMVRNDGLHITQKKTGDYNNIPLAEQAQSILGSQPCSEDLASQTPVFLLPISNEMVNRHLKKWARNAGIQKKVTTHVARHTFATLLMTADTNLYTIQHLMGHRDIRITQIYTKMLHRQKVEAVAKMPTLTT
ncbi:MAG: site-specific integrase [Candidatus Kapabacteria bacterium]|nr:site-specific integrase [Candidatus Kapabacteria bacterium]